MVDRVVSKRTASARKPNKIKRGRGRPKGGESQYKRVAREQAKLTGSGKLPDELLREWADTGFMEYVRSEKKRTRVQLEPSDRISCAKGCAAWYRPAMQPRQAPGEQPPVVRVELDEKMIAALAAKSPDKLDVLRDVLRAIGAGGVDLEQAGESSGQADPSRYGRMLSESSDVAGRA